MNIRHKLIETLSWLDSTQSQTATEITLLDVVAHFSPDVTQAHAKECDRLKEQICVLQSQVDNSDINLEQCRLNYKGTIKKLTEERDQLRAELLDTKVSNMNNVAAFDQLHAEFNRFRAELAATREVVENAKGLFTGNGSEYRPAMLGVLHDSVIALANLARSQQPEEKCDCDNFAGIHEKHCKLYKQPTTENQ